MAIKPFNSVNGFSVGETPTAVILANGDITTGNATLTGNLAANNVLTDNLRYANGVPWDFQQAAGNGNYQIQYNLDNDFGASSNFTFNPTSNLLTVTGNASITNTANIGTINVGNLAATGNVTANSVTANYYGFVYANTILSGANKGITFNDGNTLTVSNTFSFDKTTNAVSLTGNITVSNADLGNLATANYFTGVFTAAASAQPNIKTVGTLDNLNVAGTGAISGANLVSANYITGTLTTASQPNITQVGTLGNLNVQSNIVAGNVTGANLISASFLTGTLTTSAQPNITSIGTLSSLYVTGNANVDGAVNAGNLSVANRVITSLIPATNNTQELGGSGNLWANVWVSNIKIGTTYITSTANVVNLDNANVANNTSTGTLTVRQDAAIQGNVTVTGNLTVAGNTTYINVSSLSIQDPLIDLGGTANGGNASAYDGKDRGLILRNYRADGNGAINQAFIWKTANGEFQAISNVSTIVNEDVTAASFGNIRLNAVVGNLQGTVLQANQPNITQVGTLGNLTISGNLLVQTAANIVSLKAGPLTFPSVDGVATQVLATHGNGELYFTTVSTSSLANGSSNVNVLPSGNVTISSAGNANILVVTGTGVNVAGYLNVTGTATFGGNINAGNLIIGNSSIRSVTATTSSTSANQTIATFSLTGVRGAIFDVKGEDATGGKYSIATVSAVHNGTAVDYSVYGTVLVGGYTGSLAVNIISGNMYLGVTPASSNSTVWTTQFRTI
jgi:hypothetical protein